MTFYVEKKKKICGENFWIFFFFFVPVSDFEIRVRNENKKRNGADPVNILVRVMSLKGENDFR